MKSGISCFTLAPTRDGKYDDTKSLPPFITMHFELYAKFSNQFFPEIGFDNVSYSISSLAASWSRLSVNIPMDVTRKGFEIRWKAHKTYLLESLVYVNELFEQISILGSHKAFSEDTKSLATRHFQTRPYRKRKSLKYWKDYVAGASNSLSPRRDKSFSRECGNTYFPQKSIKSLDIKHSEKRMENINNFLILLLFPCCHSENI